MLHYWITVFAAGLGIVLSIFLYHKKSTGEKLICPIGHHCNTVIHSKYSRFLGIKLELIGLAYYSSVFLGYILFILFKAHSEIVMTSLFFMTIGALFFSIYLIGIQGLVLRQWCTWCLMSAGLSIIIFMSIVTSPLIDIASVLTNYQSIIIIAHLIGITLGVGGATFTDIFFFKFLNDFKISEDEASVLHTLSQVVWFGIILLILSGIALYIPNAEIYNQSAKFLMKMIVVSVILINGILLNAFVSPRLVNISFGGKHHHEIGELHANRKLAFALGAISMVSWYSALILGALRNISLSLSQLFGLYISILVLAIIASQLTERYFELHANQKPN